MSFNLTLTASQQHSRAQVPLPYSHDGEVICTVTTRLSLTSGLSSGNGSLNKAPGSSAVILYDPDSADDIDDDDPDEDLDI